MATLLESFEAIVRRANLFDQRGVSGQADLHPFDVRNIHPRMPVKVRKLFDDGYYSEATFEAFKYVDKTVQKHSKASESGFKLMMQVFDEAKPLPILNETVWFHIDTGTLVVTDLLFCVSETSQGIAAMVSRLLGIHGTLGMSRTMKLAIKDKQALAKSVLPLLALPVKRVIVAHDQIINEQPMAKLAQAFAWLQ